MFKKEKRNKLSNIDLNNNNENLLMNLDVTSCCICNDNHDEDLILLCDGEGCENETHMFCLRPPLFKVPDSEWYCSECKPINTCSSSNIISTIDKHIDQYNNENFVLKESYKNWLILNQHQYIPLKEWYINFPHIEIKSEFDISSINLIGKPIKLFLKVEKQYHTGRIISRRYDSLLDRWEHLIQFKSGSDNRNKDVIKWICVDEFPCMIGGDVVWAKISQFPWWVGIEYYRSGIDLIMKSYDKDRMDELGRPSIHSVYKTFVNMDSDIVMISFYGDDSIAFIQYKDKDTNIIPLARRLAQGSSNMTKKLAVSYACATIEMEEQNRGMYIHQFLSNSDMQENGGLISGLTLKLLKSLTSNNKISSISSLASPVKSINEDENHNNSNNNIHNLYNDYINIENHVILTEIKKMIKSAYNSKTFLKNDYFIKTKIEPNNSNVSIENNEIRQILSELVQKCYSCSTGSIDSNNNENESVYNNDNNDVTKVQSYNDLSTEIIFNNDSNNCNIDMNTELVFHNVYESIKDNRELFANKLFTSIQEKKSVCIDLLYLFYEGGITSSSSNTCSAAINITKINTHCSILGIYHNNYSDFNAIDSYNVYFPSNNINTYINNTKKSKNKPKRKIDYEEVEFIEADINREDEIKDSNNDDEILLQDAVLEKKSISLSNIDKDIDNEMNNEFQAMTKIQFTPASLFPQLSINYLAYLQLEKTKQNILNEEEKERLLQIKKERGVGEIENNIDLADNNVDENIDNDNLINKCHSFSSFITNEPRRSTRSRNYIPTYKESLIDYVKISSSNNNNNNNEVLSSNDDYSIQGSVYLSDLHRSTWVGTVVISVLDCVIGRVVSSKKGNVKIRSLSGVTIAKSTDVQVISEDSGIYSDFNIAESEVFNAFNILDDDNNNNNNNKDDDNKDNNKDNDDDDQKKDIYDSIVNNLFLNKDEMDCGFGMDLLMDMHSSGNINNIDLNNLWIDDKDMNDDINKTNVINDQGLTQINKYINNNNDVTNNNKNSALKQRGVKSKINSTSLSKWTKIINDSTSYKSTRIIPKPIKQVNYLDNETSDSINNSINNSIINIQHKSRMPPDGYTCIVTDDGEEIFVIDRRGDDDEVVHLNHNNNSNSDISITKVMDNQIIESDNIQITTRPKKKSRFSNNIIINNNVENNTGSVNSNMVKTNNTSTATNTIIINNNNDVNNNNNSKVATDPRRNYKKCSTSNLVDPIIDIMKLAKREDELKVNDNDNIDDNDTNEKNKSRFSEETQNNIVNFIPTRNTLPSPNNLIFNANNNNMSDSSYSKQLASIYISPRHEELILKIEDFQKLQQVLLLNKQYLSKSQKRKLHMMKIECSEIENNSILQNNDKNANKISSSMSTSAVDNTLSSDYEYFEKVTKKVHPLLINPYSNTNNGINISSNNSVIVLETQSIPLPPLPPTITHNNSNHNNSNIIIKNDSKPATIYHGDLVNPLARVGSNYPGAGDLEEGEVVEDKVPMQDLILVNNINNNEESNKTFHPPLLRAPITVVNNKANIPLNKPSIQSTTPASRSITNLDRKHPLIHDSSQIVTQHDQPQFPINAASQTSYETSKERHVLHHTRQPPHSHMLPLTNITHVSHSQPMEKPPSTHTTNYLQPSQPPRNTNIIQSKPLLRVTNVLPQQYEQVNNHDTPRFQMNNNYIDQNPPSSRIIAKQNGTFKSHPLINITVSNTHPLINTTVSYTKSHPLLISNTQAGNNNHPLLNSHNNNTNTNTKSNNEQHQQQQMNRNNNNNNNNNNSNNKRNNYYNNNYNNNGNNNRL